MNKKSALNLCTCIHVHVYTCTCIHSKCILNSFHFSSTEKGKSMSLSSSSQEGRYYTVYTVHTCKFTCTCTFYMQKPLKLPLCHNNTFITSEYWYFLPLYPVDCYTVS